MKNKRKAFTLSEILVVLGILIALIAILTPVFFEARVRADQAGALIGRPRREWLPPPRRVRAPHKERVVASLQRTFWRVWPSVAVP